MSYENLKAAGFVSDPTWNGHVRWTHFDKGITCLRQPYMSDMQWDIEQQRCIAKATDHQNSGEPSA